MTTMQQAYVQVVSVALGLCKLHTILNKMVKAAQLMLGGFLALCQMLGCSPYEPSLAPIICMVGAILFAQK